ncbi:hypothetical protein Bca52824_082960 [Brassica carinata]|uniref:Uncharacterized protein n=1 Tax=Brassica carinata TaxID=52824 RepID=A0A8X7TT32_BRACI|nr:hypothetical protein Bca52824_082960 [Brassica carinata]
MLQTPQTTRTCYNLAKRPLREPEQAARTRHAFELIEHSKALMARETEAAFRDTKEKTTAQALHAPHQSNPKKKPRRQGEGGLLRVELDATPLNHRRDSRSENFGERDKHTPDQLPPSNTPTRKHQSPYTLTPELPPSSPTTELPSWYTPTPELPPPSYNPTPVFPPSYTATPELPPSYMPTPEVPAPSPAPY